MDEIKNESQQASASFANMSMSIREWLKDDWGGAAILIGSFLFAFVSLLLALLCTVAPLGLALLGIGGIAYGVGILFYIGHTLYLWNRGWALAIVKLLMLPGYIELSSVLFFQIIFRGGGPVP